MMKIAVCLIIVGLAAGFMSELAAAGGHEDCACCAKNKCHVKTTCHDSAKACFCSYQAAKVCVVERPTPPVLVCAGELMQSLRFTYLYLSVEDIFHPPRA